MTLSWKKRHIEYLPLNIALYCKGTDTLYNGLILL